MSSSEQPASKLFQPLQLGSIGALKHRVILAPLTRNRATEPDLSPSSRTVQYYRQRASPGGLVITEATNISPESLAYPSTPGIWSEAQINGWKEVTKAVHDNGGFVVCQLWHTGRVAHPSFANHPAGQRRRQGLVDRHRYTPCVSSSPSPIVDRRGKPGKTVTYDGTVADYAVPRALGQEDISRLCLDYAEAAQNAKIAGFDGVELHAAHGYLIDQFLNDGVNQRTDEYGGSAENRCRLLQRVLEAILQIWPAPRVGVRLSPHDAPNGGNTYHGCTDSNPDHIYLHAVRLLNRYELAYLLLTEPRWVGKHDDSPETDPGYQMPLMNLKKYRRVYQGTLVSAGGFTPNSSYEMMKYNDNEESINREQGYDAIAFGRWFISNPDLPLRLRMWHDYKRNKQQKGLITPPRLNRYERDTFYSHEAKGYIDYPSLEYEEAQKGGEKNRNISKAFDGMEIGKYPLVEQHSVGKSLRVTTHRSRL